MWKLLVKIFRTGRLTEKSSRPVTQPHTPGFGRSLAIRHVDAGSCNGCELELLALENPYYALSSDGAKFVASPRHADLLVVTGPVTKAMKDPLTKTLEATPEPRRVLAVGDCACDGGVFRDSYAVCNGVSPVIPVDHQVPGCPPPPDEIRRAILRAFALPRQAQK